jgi:hypothetical protein
VVREGWGQGGEMNQALYAHMNNKRKKKKQRVHIWGRGALGWIKNWLFVAMTTSQIGF